MTVFTKPSPVPSPHRTTVAVIVLASVVQALTVATLIGAFG